MGDQSVSEHFHKPEQTHREGVKLNVWHRHGDRPPGSEQRPELKQQRTTIRSTNIQNGRMLHELDWTPTSQTCCQQALFRTRGKYCSHEKVINRKYTAALPPPTPSLRLRFLDGKNNRCASHPLPCSCTALSQSRPFCLALRHLSST